MRRLAQRGMGFSQLVGICNPWKYTLPHGTPYLEDVKCTQIHYYEKGIAKYREIIETPVGSINGVVRFNPADSGHYGSSNIEEHLVKEQCDWRVVNYIFKGILDKLAPNYDEFERVEDELGDTGIAVALLPERTPYQNAWVRLASFERVVIDFNEQPEELQEYIEIQRQYHMQAAEIVAESPATYILLADHITNTISPKYYREYCIPFYKIYSKALEGTGKVLGTHIDGLGGHLKKEIKEAPIKVWDSFTVPPVGNVSLTEAKLELPDKILWVNCPPHLAWAEPEEMRKGYEAIVEEWGSKKGILIGDSELLPVEKEEEYLSIALDVFGYPDHQGHDGHIRSIPVNPGMVT